MDTNRPVFLAPERETPASFERAGRFFYRAAYARSTDSRSNNELGQDYLTFRVGEERFAFALCDGVSQSFYGDLAARILGDTLLQWAWDLDFGQPDGYIQENLRQELKTLTDEASRLVRDYPIPENVPAMVRGVLDKKRAIGSEATFVMGILDFSQEAACLAWMGDSRLRLWRASQEINAPFDGLFKTSERWSTVKGLVGELHLARLSISEFDHLAAYSDGFAYLDDAYSSTGKDRAFSDRAINAFIKDAASRPSSDDISFIEIWTTPKPPKLPRSGENLAAPNPHYSQRNDAHFLDWRPVAGANQYEIRFSSENQTTLSSLKTDACAWKADSTLDANAHWLSVRAWTEAEPGPWSGFLPIQRPSAAAPPRQTGPLPALPPSEPQVHLPATLPPAQSGLPRPAAVAFSAPPPATSSHSGQQINPRPSQPIPAPPARSWAWTWWLLTLVVVCLGATVVGGLTLGREGILAAVLGRPTQTLLPTQTPKPKPPTRLPLPGRIERASETPSLDPSQGLEITATLSEEGALPAPELATPELTPFNPPLLPPFESPTPSGQVATIKTSVRLRPYPNLQYTPAPESREYVVGNTVTISKKFSLAGVDWFYVRAVDGQEGWLMSTDLNLDGIDLESIPLDENVKFPPAGIPFP